jgi:large subunit ribosomal protein L11
MPVVEVLVPGGKATASPPLGPALGPLGVNVKAVIEKVNEMTKEFNGIQVPIKITIDDKKAFTIKVGVPPTSALVKQELKIETGSDKPNEKIVGNLTIKGLAKIARLKRNDSLAKNMKNVAKEIVGTCSSLGVTIESLRAKDAILAINSGKFDSDLSE